MARHVEPDWMIVQAARDGESSVREGWGRRMSTANKLALIAAGYAVCVVIGFAAVALNELRMPEDAAQGSPGMVAFGDMILFFFVTGVFGLIPTWFLLRLFLDKAPRALTVILLVVAALGPASWLMVRHLAGGPPGVAPQPQILWTLLGPFIAFIALPRMVLGPAIVAVEAVTFMLVRERVTRALLVVAMLMDFVPISIFALHILRAPRY
jgi:hypothetical protein